MKRVAAAAIILAALALAGPDAFPDEGRTILSYTYYLLADNPETALKDLRSFAPSRKGYVSYFSSDRIVLRVPPAEIPTVKKRLSEIGYVTDEQEKRQDYSAAMLDLETRLSVKQKLMTDLAAIFTGAKLADTLRVEQEIGRVIVEIEDLKGKINYYRDRFSLSDVTVHINRSGAGSGTKQGVSTQWEWIRNLGIERLVRD